MQHQMVYEMLREKLIVGQLEPGKGISLRGISDMLKVGIMPARDAIRRLSAENALEVQPNRRVCVPRLTPARFDELMQARLALEPLCGARALPFVDGPRLQRMIDLDAEMNSNYRTGDAATYMLSNYRFHFELYRAGGAGVLLLLLESLWVQFGPFMRTIYDVVDEAEIIDKHQMALDAIRRRDAEALKVAIQADILDGIYLLRRTIPWES
ncbi:GntR family transcriptional regulator [Tianweitania sediminis]|uniref:GntR family transcriptional regulator n=1 Tax=Tianweitania sediminis TaxID=1502156 RepID=A0A8J7UH21_9HYPH|nr:GntR family transcriptional regulator [Tianweitania sediminis]MBP0437313.1 GntR family transcriptional regulator [Tianweitania sediminis]